MANTENLQLAKETKYDEFYTQYNEIQQEMNAYIEYNPDTFRGKTVLCPCDDPEWSNFTRFFAQNFEMLGLKRLVSTSYSSKSKSEKYQRDIDYYHQITMFEWQSDEFDEEKTDTHGKIFILDRDEDDSCAVDIDNLKWHYLEGDGDFRSDEVKTLRDEADFIITNPPFSMYKDFMTWIFEAGKQFIVIGQQNSITYSYIFPRIIDNRMWIGATNSSEDMVFAVPDDYDIAPKDQEKAARMGYVGRYTRMGNTCWFSNVEHGRRHQFLQLMSMDDNLRYSKHAKIREEGYPHYDNYDAIDIRYVDAIPNDYDGVMGVPITFLDKYNPDQFKIIGATESEGKGFSNGLWDADSGVAQATVNGERRYKRLFIQAINT